MGLEHNFLALQVMEELLKGLRTGASGWGHERLTTNATRWQAIAEWPRPDIAFEDRTTKASIALEFKPPNQSKREYVTGLGQACTYLQDFEFAGLVLPERADDGTPIAEYMKDILKGTMKSMPIALLSYGADPSSLTTLQKLRTRKNPPKEIPSGVGKKKFWAYWRDISNYEVLELLKLLDRTDQSFNDTFRLFFNDFSCTGKAQLWDGTTRKAKDKNQPSYDAERINAFYALRHTGLLDSNERLTAAGYRLLHTGRVYEPYSIAFLEQLARQILIGGQHLELIFWIERVQRNLPLAKKKTAKHFYVSLDELLSKEGIIAPRRGSEGKLTFLRDEPKLWNKLGLLLHKNKNQYFHPDYGLAFNWRKIVSIANGSTPE